MGNFGWFAAVALRTVVQGTKGKTGGKLKKNSVFSMSSVRDRDKVCMLCNISGVEV